MKAFVENLFEIPFRPKTILHNRYQIEQFIGKGSYGMVYCAMDLQDKRFVIVKQLRKRKTKVRAGMLQHEANILSTLDHPSIPKLIDLFDTDKRNFLVMEFMEGDNVEDLIFMERKVFSEKESFKLLLNVIPVIEYIHGKNLVHRDLRLPNLLLSPSKVSVIDLGLATFIGHHLDKEPLESMPLEKRLYREPAVKSDFYALGHFLLFLLYSGYKPSSKQEQSWEEELSLSPPSVNLIRKLLQIDSPYKEVLELKEDVVQVLEKL